MVTYEAPSPPPYEVWGDRYQQFLMVQEWGIPELVCWSVSQVVDCPPTTTEHGTIQLDDEPAAIS